MAGSFTSPGASSTTKSHGGKPNRPRRTASNEKGPIKRDYPLTDSFASKEIPPRSKRRDCTCHRRSFAKR